MTAVRAHSAPGAGFAPVAALMGDPARAAMLTALLEDRALAAGELANLAGVSPATASEHLTRLRGGGLVNGADAVDEGDLAVLDRHGESVSLEAAADSTILVLSGAPIDEPVVGYGPFVMNTEAEIRKAMEDYRSGRMGSL